MAFRTFDVRRDSLDFTFSFNDDERLALRSNMLGNGAITREDLRRIALWKLDRVVDIPDRVIDMLRQLAVQKDLTADCEQSRSAIAALVECDGVGFPMASAFLKFLRPDVFPIIDVRAYRALRGKRIRHHAYAIEMYLEYVRDLQSIATQTQRQLSDIDEQLYCFDIKHNGAIG